LRKRKVFLLSAASFLSLALVLLWVVFLSGRFSILADLVVPGSPTTQNTSNVVKTVSPTPQEVKNSGSVVDNKIKVSLAINGSASPSVHYQATVDGNANIDFSGSTVTVTDADYEGVSDEKISGDLTGCKLAALGDEETGRVSLTSNSDPFRVHIKDNGSGPADYSFDLYCVAQTSASSISYQATVDGNANIDFSGSTATVADADYEGVSDEKISGDLTGCKLAALGDEETGRVSLTSNSDPFRVHIKDNGSGPADYSFELYCLTSSSQAMEISESYDSNYSFDKNQEISIQGPEGNLFLADDINQLDEPNRYFVQKQENTVKFLISQGTINAGEQLNLSFYLGANVSTSDTCIDKNSYVKWGQFDLETAAVSGDGVDKEDLPKYCYNLTSVSSQNPQPTSGVSSLGGSLLQTGISILLLLIITLVLVASVLYIIALAKEDKE